MTAGDKAGAASRSHRAVSKKIRAPAVAGGGVLAGGSAPLFRRDTTTPDDHGGNGGGAAASGGKGAGGRLSRRSKKSCECLVPVGRGRVAEGSRVKSAGGRVANLSSVAGDAVGVVCHVEVESDTRGKVAKKVFSCDFAGRSGGGVLSKSVAPEVTLDGCVSSLLVRTSAGGGGRGRSVCADSD